MLTRNLKVHNKFRSIVKISDGICGYVAGGLGNQLFMLAAAWEQAHRLNVPLYLDTSHYRVRGTREFELTDFISPAQDLGAQSPWTSIRVSKERVLPAPKRLNPFTQSVFFEKNVTIYDEKINQVKPGTTLLGYFQSPLYFENVATLMATGINLFPATSAERDLIASMEDDPRITLHLRRGDYLLPSSNEQFVASVSYAERALRVLEAMGVDQRIRVFSDSPELVKKELEHWDADIEIVENTSALSTISTIKAMSAGTSFIMSNSSFSWWAAWLMNQKANSAHNPVIAPRPWVGSGVARVDMLLKNWLTLDARD